MNRGGEVCRAGSEHGVVGRGTTGRPDTKRSQAAQTIGGRSRLASGGGKWTISNKPDIDCTRIDCTTATDTDCMTIPMKCDLKAVISLTLWNALIAAGVFLPVFLIALQVEVLVRVGVPDGGFLYELGAAVYVYVGMVGPVVMASLVYTLASLFVPVGWIKKRPRLVAVALSPLIPGVIIALNLSGAHFLLVFYSGVVATIAYGAWARTGRSVFGSEGDQDAT